MEYGHTSYQLDISLHRFNCQDQFKRMMYRLKAFVVYLNGLESIDRCINVTGISGTMITMPDMAYVSIFMDNDLTHITEDHFEIKLIARLLDQMHVVQPPMFPLRYDDTPPSAPQFPEHLHLLLTRS